MGGKEKWNSVGKHRGRANKGRQEEERESGGEGGSIKVEEVVMERRGKKEWVA